MTERAFETDQIEQKQTERLHTASVKFVEHVAPFVVVAHF